MDSHNNHSHTINAKIKFSELSMSLRYYTNNNNNNNRKSRQNFTATEEAKLTNEPFYRVSSKF